MQSTTTPHLLVNVSAPDKALVLNLLATGEVVLAYQGRWCCFQYSRMDVVKDSPYLKLAIQLVNSFLHYGQFTAGQDVQLYHGGVWIATAEVEEVVEPCLYFWDNFPFNSSQKQLFPIHEVEPVISNWITTLSGNTNLVIESTSASDHRLVIKNVTHRTLLLKQAQQICQTLKNAPWKCCYKVAYQPPSYGLLDLFLENFSLAFVLYNQTHFVKGTITVN